MKYFTHISHWYAHKNRRDEAIYKYLRSQERRIINGDGLAAFKVQIVDNINAINEKYPRCIPATVSWTYHVNGIDSEYKRGDLRLDVNNFSICNFHVYQSTDPEVSQP